MFLSGNFTPFVCGGMRLKTHIKASSNFHVGIQWQRVKAFRHNKTICPGTIGINRNEIAILYTAIMSVASAGRRHTCKNKAKDINVLLKTNKNPTKEL